MKFLVLGLTGKRGCGKDTMAEYLKSKYGFRVLTYTNDVLAPILKSQGREVTRENLINLALEMRATSGKHILTQLMCDKIDLDGFWVISGVRYPEEVAYFKERFGGAFRLAKIEARLETRYSRVVRRGTKGEAGMSMEKFMEIEGKETERMISETMKLAGFSVDNNGTKDGFFRKIDGLSEKFGISQVKPAKTPKP